MPSLRSFIFHYLLSLLSAWTSPIHHHQTRHATIWYLHFYITPQSRLRTHNTNNTRPGFLSYTTLISDLTVLLDFSQLFILRGADTRRDIWYGDFNEASGLCKLWESHIYPNKTLLGGVESWLHYSTSLWWWWWCVLHTVVIIRSSLRHVFLVWLVSE